MSAMLTRKELAQQLGISTRTLDRWRDLGLDLGEFRFHPNASPRFDPEKVRQAMVTGKFRKAKKRAMTEPAPEKSIPSQAEPAANQPDEPTRVLAV